MTLEYSNIFDAITKDKAEASELQTRSDLMIVIRDIINAKNWSQADAGIKLGLTQPRVSDLVNGRIDKFSIDKLMTCLYRIGFRFKPSFTDDQLTMKIEAVKTHSLECASSGHKSLFIRMRFVAQMVRALRRYPKCLQTLRL